MLLPESQTARYDAVDYPFFEAKFKELCPGIEVVYPNADQKAADRIEHEDLAPLATASSTCCC